MKLNLKVVQVGNIVKIDGSELEGYISHILCQICAGYQVFYEKYDSFFCPRCNIWLEDKCYDPDCQYCSHKPDKPLGALQQNR